MRATKLLTLLLSVLTASTALAVPPQLPRILMDTRYTPAACDVTYTSATPIQTIVNNATCGQTICLTAGTTFTIASPPLLLPDKNCTDTTWVTIRTSTPDGDFPREGNRVSPSHAPLMAKITGGYGAHGVLIESESGAGHYRFIGIELTASSVTQTMSDLIRLNEGWGDLATQTHHIIVDRCYLYPNPARGATRGVAANGAYLAIIDSYLSGFMRITGEDSQAFAAWNGTGPYKFVNNYLEGASETVMFGGAGSMSRMFIPADVEFRRNHLFKPLGWDDSGLGVKNIFELKQVRRLLVENSRMEHTWSDGQVGYAWLLKATASHGTDRWERSEHITIRGTYTRGAANAVNLSGRYMDSLYPVSDLAMLHNVFDEVGSAWDPAGQPGYGVMINETYNFTFRHNTLFNAPHSVLWPSTSRLMNGLDYSYNITPHNSYGVKGTGYASGTATLDHWWPGGYTFTENYLQGGSCGSYPATTVCPATMAAIGFVDYAGKDYRLDPSSSYDGTADGGSDPGVWFPATVTAKSQLDWTVEVEPAYTSAIVKFGVPGLPYDQSCTVRYGTSTVTSASGPSRRTVVLTGLSPAAEYFIGIDCGNTWGGWLSWENYTATANPGGTRDVPFILGATTIPNVARAAMQCADNPELTDMTTAQNTSCASGCIIPIELAVGVNYCRHVWQNSSNTVLATSGIDPISVQ